MAKFRVWIHDAYEYSIEVDATDAETAVDSVRERISNGEDWTTGDFVYQDGDLRVGEDAGPTEEVTE